MSDLLDLISNAEKAGQQHGGEHHAPKCPWCGRGEDRLVVWPDHTEEETGRVWCRNCGESCDGLHYAREFCGMSWQEACEFFGTDPQLQGAQESDKDESTRQSRSGRSPEGTQGAGRQGGSEPAAEMPAPAPPSGASQWKRYERPSSEWRAAATTFAKKCKACLWSEAEAAESAREYLRSRGYDRSTMATAGLGLNPKDRWPDRSEWGLSGEGSLWLPRGIVIPWADSEGVSSVNVRRPPGDVEPSAEESWKQRKYQRAAGPSAPLYGVQWFRENVPAVLVEGELDALAVQQEAADICSPVATGSTSGGRRREWRVLLAKAPSVLVAFDAEEAGERASRKWLRALPNAIRWRPHAEDTSEMLKQGENLRLWARCGAEAARTRAGPA
jgi:hypothetical protein